MKRNKKKYLLLLGFLTTLICCFSVKLSAQCNGTEPNFNFPNDTVMCQGQTLVLSVPAGYNYYNWSSGQSSPTIQVTNAGTYHVTAGLIGANLVQHGDFQGGTTNTANNFTTDYTPGTGGAWGLLSNPGQYAISTSPSNVHNNFVSCGDHTTGTGNMFIANGASTANTTVWSQTIAVQPNKDYIFRFWNTNVVNDPNVAQLQLYINNSTVSAVSPTNTSACSWSQVSGTWNSGNSTQAVLKIINQSTVGGGNDFAIDDIFFAPVCIRRDTVMVTFENHQVNAGSDLTFCANAPDTLMAVSNLSGATFSWNDGTSGPVCAPASSGAYIVTATSPNGCIAKDTANVTVKAVDWFIDTMMMQPTACGGNNGIVSAMVGGAIVGLTQYSWSGPGAGSSNSIAASVWTNLSAGWYYLTVQNNGCFQHDSIEVTVSNPPVASATPNILTGTAPLTVNWSNNSSGGNSYQWDFGNGLTAQTTLPQPQNTQYLTPGTYTAQLIAENGACSDTIYWIIQVLDSLPSLELPFAFEAPNVFTPNGDNANDLYQFKLQGVQSLSATILNRWGVVMHEVTNKANVDWTGDDQKGQPCSEGVYFYQYEAKDLQGNLHKGSGFFQLMR